MIGGMISIGCYVFVVLVTNTVLPKVVATPASADPGPALTTAIPHVDANSLPVDAFYDATFVFSTGDRSDNPSQ
jgi:hypothetical protein